MHLLIYFMHLLANIRESSGRIAASFDVRTKW